MPANGEWDLTGRIRG